MKKIFLTGSSGMLGSDLNKILKKKYKVINISNTNKKIKFINYSSTKSISKFINKYGIPDYFIHMGWGRMLEPHSNYHIKENYLNSKNLIDIFFKNGLKNFIFIGTINEYGSCEGSIKEDYQSDNNLRNYEKGKIKFSTYGKKLSKKLQKNFVHIRLSNVYGSLQKKNSLIHSMHQAYNKEIQLNLSPLNFYRDFLYSKEAAIGIEKIIRNASGILSINLGSGKNISMKHFVRTYWKIIGGKKNKLKFGKLIKSKNDPKTSKFYLNLKLLKKITSWTPTNNLNKNIKDNIKNFRLMNVKN